MKCIKTTFAIMACLCLSFGYAQETNNFAQLNQLCNAGNKQACLQLANNKPSSVHKEIDNLCQVYAEVVANYSLNLFLAKDEKVFKAVRPAIFKELAATGIDKSSAEFLWKEKFDFEDKETHKALAVPYEQRLQLAKTPEFQEQVKQSLQIYYNECVLIYGEFKK